LNRLRLRQPPFTPTKIAKTASLAVKRPRRMGSISRRGSRSVVYPRPPSLKKLPQQSREGTTSRTGCGLYHTPNVYVNGKKEQITHKRHLRLHGVRRGDESRSRNATPVARHFRRFACLSDWLAHDMLPHRHLR
jgi:hypothetical protein